MDPRPPAGAPRVPGYTVERSLDQGGDAAVWAGRRHITWERVALKVLHPRFPGAAEAARREAARLAAVDHPHVLRIVELVEASALRLLTNLVDCDPRDVRIGMPVEVVFEPVENVFLPCFRPTVRPSS